MRKIILLILFGLILSAGSTIAEGYYEVADLSNSCYFNINDRSLPFVKGNGINPDAVHFYLNLQRYEGNHLLINHSSSFAMFIEGELKWYTKDNTRILWSIDSLYQAIGNPKILVTLFSQDKGYDNLHITIVKKDMSAIGSNDIFEIKEKAGLDRNIFLVMLILIFIFLAIIYNTNTKTFKDFYSLNLLLIGRVKDESVFKSKLFSQDSLIIYLLHSAILSFILLVLINFSHGYLDKELLFFQSNFLNWLVNTFLIFLFFLSKYVFIRYLGILFDLGNAANLYFYEFMRLSMIFFLSLFLLATIFIISLPYFTNELINLSIYIIIAFLSLRFVILFIRIGRIASFKKIHLFSYLCTTESIPILIGLKYLIF